MFLQAAAEATEAAPEATAEPKKKKKKDKVRARPAVFYRTLWNFTGALEWGDVSNHFCVTLALATFLSKVSELSAGLFCCVDQSCMAVV